MEIHGSSLNFSALRPSAQATGKSDADPRRPKNDGIGPDGREKSSGAITETPADVERKLAKAGILQSAATLEKANLPLDIRRLNAINAYTSQSKQSLLEQRAQLLVGIDLFV